jgi:predicted DNA-binding transcriptional regulator AlpA/predicted XRE-type DNA-binding protein
MSHSKVTPSSGNVFADLGLIEPDVELAKADLAIRIHRLAEHRRLTADEAAALLQLQRSELPALFQGRLATCSLDQLLRMLTWLGDDVEILIRPRLQRTKRGALRVLQAAAVDKPDDFVPVRAARGKRPAGAVTVDRFVSPDAANAVTGSARASTTPGDDRQLLDKHAVETMTSLDITTIYRRMAAGSFPQPVRVGRRRVAWRSSDIVKWQQGLEVGTETLRWKTRRAREANPRGGVQGRRGRD